MIGKGGGLRMVKHGWRFSLWQGRKHGIRDIKGGDGGSRNRYEGDRNETLKEQRKNSRRYDSKLKLAEAFNTDLVAF